MDLLVKPTLKHGPLKDAPLVQVSGDIEQPVARLAGDEAKARVEIDCLRATTRQASLMPKTPAA